MGLFEEIDKFREDKRAEQAQQAVELGSKWYEEAISTLGKVFEDHDVYLADPNRAYSCWWPLGVPHPQFRAYFCVDDLTLLVRNSVDTSGGNKDVHHQRFVTGVKSEEIELSAQELYLFVLRYKEIRVPSNNDWTPASTKPGYQEVFISSLGGLTRTNFIELISWIAPGLGLDQSGVIEAIQAEPPKE